MALVHRRSRKLEIARSAFEDKWYKHATTHLQPFYTGTFEEWKAARRVCQTDLFVLAKKYLKLDLIDNFYCPKHQEESFSEAIPCSQCGRIMVPYAEADATGVRSIHRQICNAFVSKSPDRKLYDQDCKKIRLILCSRGTFKSSINRADTVQWVINFPDIRIVIFSASPDLGTSFVKSVKEWFIINERTDEEHPKDEKTIHCNERYVEFQQLFPEHLVLSKKKESEDRFLSPARVKSAIEPTILTLPLVGNTAGYHFDVGKFDDCVSDVNCGPTSTAESRAQVGENIRLKRKLIMLMGFKDYVGTPYTSDDYYSYALERTKPEIILIRPCWTVKFDARFKHVDELQESDVTLTFPFDGKGEPQLTFSALKREAQDDYYLFTCQFLCEPQISKVVRFTEELILAHTVQAEGLPQAGTFNCFSAWDLAGSDGASADFTVGCVGWFPTAGPLAGRMFVREIVMGRFSPSEVEYQVAHLAAKWRAEGISIEGSPGSYYAQNGILREMIRCGYSDGPRPDFFKVDTKKDAKNHRAANLESLLVNNLLWFSSDIPIMETVIKQFVNFKPHSKRKDDIVDAVAHLSRHLPSYVAIPQTTQQLTQAVIDVCRDKQLQELLYPEAPPIAEPPPPELPKTWEGMPVYRHESELYGS